MDSWKSHWRAFLPENLFSFGEDLFGNQLVLVPGSANVFLWDHETGELLDLFVEPFELLNSIITSGIDWIELYEDGSLVIARGFGPVPADQHLHWVVPLALGGLVTSENLALVERSAHLIGHAELWKQVGDLPPGSAIVPR